MKKTVLALLAVVASAGLSHAGSLMVMYTAPFSGTVGDADFDIQLPQFDPSLGVLCEVIVDLDANTSAGSIAFDNEAGTPSEVTLGIGAEVTATAPAALALVAVPLQTGDGNVDADNDGAADFLGTDSFSVTGGAGNDSDSDSLVNPPADLSAYIGLGTIDVTIGNSVETLLSSSGGFGPINPIPGVFDGTVMVTYKFDSAIPEPASALLAAIGLVGFATRRVR